MSILNLKLPAGSQTCNGKQITFKAPCDSTGIAHLEIEGSLYTIVDYSGGYIDIGNGDYFRGNSYVSVILDDDNRLAYLVGMVGYQKPWDLYDNVAPIHTDTRVRILTVQDISSNKGVVSSKSKGIKCINSGTLELEIVCKSNESFSRIGGTIEVYADDNLKRKLTFTGIQHTEKEVEETLELTVRKGEIIYLLVDVKNESGSYSPDLQVFITLSANVDTPYKYLKLADVLLENE